MNPQPTSKKGPDAVTTTDDQADRLASIAAQLVARVRDDRPDDVGTWLARELPNPADWWALAFVLAAAVPITLPFSHLTAWARTQPDVIAQRRAILTGRLKDTIGTVA